MAEMIAEGIPGLEPGQRLVVYFAEKEGVAGDGFAGGAALAHFEKGGD